jgi:hypothetical protein
MTIGWAAAALMLSLVCAAPSSAGQLDLDVYSSGAVSPLSGPGTRPRGGFGWKPGDPRDLQGEPSWVHYASHMGYTGLAAAGLAGSLATGGVAPAVGFGIVTAIQLFRAWGYHKASSRSQSSVAGSPQGR